MVILPPAAWADWLDAPPHRSRELLQPFPAEALVADASGDALDAVLCLAQAAWAAQQPRHGLPEALLTGRASYNETVEAARHALALETTYTGKCLAALAADAKAEPAASPG